MGRKIKKRTPKRNRKYYKECERCGNGEVTKATTFYCKYCGHLNGAAGIEITRGGIDD